MIKIENTVTPSAEQWQSIILGCRNPMDSWGMSDTEYDRAIDTLGELPPELGEKDHKLLMSLAKAGTTHSKYRRMITVYADITAPFYWWKEYSTYKVGTVTNACSSMHRITSKEFTLEQFSWEHLPSRGLENLEGTIDELNFWRNIYLYGGKVDDKKYEPKDKEAWWCLIQLLPTSYNQKRTVMLNYEVLAGIYPTRKDHKLDEWHVFCDWIKKLPYSELIIGENNV